MAITQNEAEAIEMKFLDAFEAEEDVALKAKEAWDDLYQRVKAGENFRDKEDLYRELGDEYNTLGNQKRADYFYGLENEEIEKEEANRKSFSFEDIMRLNQPTTKIKIYPNDPCPCGSGKKYKKCCGRK